MTRLIKIHGMVDPHTHLRDMDWAHKATFASETAAAAAGGYWAIFDMPNTPPNTVTREALDIKLQALNNAAICDWGVYFGAAQSDNRDQYSSVAEDVCGLKMFCNATTGNLLLANQADRDAHFAAWPDKRLIAVHAEEEIVAEILELVRRYRKPTHFLHISTAYEIQLLTAAKEEGLPITVGVCPHHLYLTEADERALGAFAKMKPSLKTATDRDALWRAIAVGIVDIVESDHAPHTLEEKNAPTPPYGVTGLETTLPLLLTAVHEGRLTLAQVIALVAETPRRIWELSCPPQTYALVDLDMAYTIDNAALYTACGWSPFDGMRVTGKVCETWIRGQQVFDGEKILAKPGFGDNLFIREGV